MVQIIGENRKPSFAEKFSRAIGTGLNEGTQLYQQHQENKALEEMGLGYLTGLSPENKRLALADALKGRSESQQKTLSAAQQGLEAVQRQKERLASGFLGPKVSLLPGQESKLLKALSPEGRATRAAYEQAGKELIQLASTLPIRNRLEFETLSHKLYDPTMTESEIGGVLDEMEKHIQDAINAAQSPRAAGMQRGSQNKSSSQTSAKTKFDLNNPEHKAKRDQVLKKVGGDRKKAEEILNREFE